MSEETQFWGITVPGPLRGESKLLPGWRLTVPDGKTIRFYPVFSSSERADEFVRKHGRELMVENRQLVEKLREDIRPIKRDEIPDGHHILSDRRGLVTWAELLEEC